MHFLIPSKEITAISESVAQICSYNLDSRVLSFSKELLGNYEDEGRETRPVLPTKQESHMCERKKTWKILKENKGIIDDRQVTQTIMKIYLCTILSFNIIGRLCKSLLHEALTFGNVTSTLGEVHQFCDPGNKKGENNTMTMFDKKRTEVLWYRRTVIEKMIPVILFSPTSRFGAQLGGKNHCSPKGKSLVSNTAFHFTAQWSKSSWLP